ncbi:hypothetical protein [Photobacterium kishitanii]|uniref:Uncharacterized protein n=1 Tax=Photobacterium kishitanii TaxID=318456 RepID=A0A2T3KN06_9GAMM|nr:hypothetical protein [Photobacterium kishitanii]PSV01180.1 hypothetical protein C9J27_03915 [Photobacterium kishitanii]
MKSIKTKISLYDLFTDGCDAFNFTNNKIVAEHMCLSAIYDVDESSFTTILDGVNQIEVGGNTYITEGFCINNEIHLSGFKISNSIAAMENIDRDKYNKLLNSCKSGSGICVLSGTKCSPVKDILNQLVTDLSVAGISYARVVRLGEHYFCFFDSHVLEFESIRKLKDFIVESYLNIIVIEVGNDSNLARLSGELAVSGACSIIVKPAKSGCHLIEDIASTLGATFLSTYLKSVLFVASVPLVNDEDNFSRVLFSSDARSSYWENIKSSPTSDEYILVEDRFDDAVSKCNDKITLCEFIENNKLVSRYIKMGLSAPEYISNFNLSPEWKSIYDRSAIIMRERKSTADFIDFFIGRY